MLDRHVPSRRTPRLTRHEIPHDLRVAKEVAVERIFPASRAATAHGPRAVRTDPQHNVVGVGVGRKVVRGRRTTRPCVRFYVVRKLDKRLIPPRHLLPKEIEGVETDVIETGTLHAQIGARTRQRPASPGASIGFRLDPPHDDLLMAGTLGALVARNETRFILSNNHVLANENQLALGTAISQPGPLDEGDPTTDVIARLSQFVPLTAAGPNRVDCAIAELTASDLVRARALPKVGKLTDDVPIDAALDMRVEKVGRGSGYTEGTIVDVTATVSLQYDLGTLTFVDQIFISGASGQFSQTGDSGALVVDATSGRAAGLLIGGNGQHSIANHLDEVLNELDVTLVI